MKKQILVSLSLMLFLISFTSILSAQKATIKGVILETNGTAVEFGSVVLNNATDSSMVKGEFTGIDGAFELTRIPYGSYWIAVSYVGFPTYKTDVFELNSDMDLGTIELEAATNELDEVVVTATRPLLEMKPDKMVFNVDGSTNAAGNTALELLQKSPGVVVDNNDNIQMLGRSGVRVYIDGKPSPLRGDDLAAFLRTLQSNEIDAIEIITNPSARYEAEGNAGIINIKLKKDKKLGTNANINLGTSVGEETVRSNAGINGNYRNKNINTFASYNYYNGEGYNVFNLYREQLGNYFDQQNIGRGNWESHNFKLGTDFFLNDKHTVGFLVNSSISDNAWGTISRTPMGVIQPWSLDSVLIADSPSERDRDNANFNLNYQFDNGKGKTLSIDADYGIFRNTAEERTTNTYKDASEVEILRRSQTLANTPTDIDIYTFKTDYEMPLAEGKLGLGAKIAYVRTDNTFDWYNINSGEQILDIDRSNQFTYTENVNAAYVTYNRQIKKVGINAGLRVEQTNSEGDLVAMKVTENENVNRSYLDFFPSGGVTFSPNQKNSFQLNYSRRINRPSYQDLNPFRSQLDELTAEQGNPFLRPEYSNSVQLSHTWNYALNTKLSYSHTKDLITRFTDTLGVNGSFITWLNLSKQEAYSINVSAPIPIQKWWNSYTSLTGAHTRNEADYGDGKTVNLKASTFNIYSQHTFKLPLDISFEISGWYSSPSLWGGTFEMEEMWSISAGLQKKIFDGRGNVRLSFDDIFKTNEWSGVSQFGILYMDANGGFDSRRVKLNVSYLFGNTEVKQARRRKTGLEEESSRVKSDN